MRIINENTGIAMRVFISTDTSCFALHKIKGSTKPLAAFQSWAAIQKALKSENRKPGRSGQISEKSLEFLRDRHEQVEKRIKKGFLVEEAEQSEKDDCYTPYDIAFAEHGLRSHTHSILALFPYYTNRNGKLRTGWQKHQLLKSNAKINALDRKYIKLNDKFIGGFRIDIDRSFESIESLKEWLTFTGVPWPNVVVGEGLADGAIVRPHLWYMLHPDDAVWSDKNDPRCRKKPVKLVKAIAKAITYELIEYGADPGGLENLFHGKNPLSPYNDTFVINDKLVPLNDLHDLTGLDLRIDNGKQKNTRTLNENIAIRISRVASDAGSRKRRPILKASDRSAVASRISAQIASNLPLEQSNNLFNSARSLAFDYIRLIMNTQKDLYDSFIEDRAFMSDSILEFLCEVMKPSKGEEKVLERLASHAAGVWDPAHRSLQKAYGAMLHEFDETMSTRDRQAAAGKRTAELKKQSSLDQLRDAQERLKSAGVPISTNSLSRESRLSIATVKRLKSQL